MAKIVLCAFLVLGFSVAGCSEANPPAEAVPQTEAATTAPVATSTQGVIPQAQLDAMAKAAATGTVLEQAEQERRKQMEAQGL